MKRWPSRLPALLTVVAVTITACGGDDDADTTTAPPTAESPGGTTEQAAPTTDPSGSSSETPEVPSLGADGTATLTAGDLSISGDVTSCLLDGNDVTMTVNGENAGIEVIPTGGGSVSVTITGMARWNGVGEATVDLGDVSIVGTGSTPDAGAPIDDFTLVAQIGAC